jgi:hypothetical protein
MHETMRLYTSTWEYPRRYYYYLCRYEADGITSKCENVADTLICLFSFFVRMYVLGW